MLNEVFLATIMGNLVTIWGLYGLWRLTKDEGDLWGYVHVLGVCAIMVVWGYGVLQSQGSRQEARAQEAPALFQPAAPATPR